MTPTPVPGARLTARVVALQVLLDCRPRGAFVQDLLDRHLTQTPLSPLDRRLATQLSYGTLRRRGTLDALLQPLVTRPMSNVEPWLWEVLRLGAYQLAILTGLAPHAVLNETVELAAVFGNPGAKGFINGVLRSLSRLVTDDRTDTPAADALSLEDGSYRRLARPIFPDPSSDFPGYLASAFGFPAWMVARWVGRYSREECLRLGRWFNQPAPLWLRVNPLKSDRDSFLRALSEAGVGAEAGEHPQSVLLRETKPVRELPGYAEGWFSVQDQSAMWVASAVRPERGGRLLDLCSAPGGKTTHLAELMGNEGVVVACDVDERRLQVVNDLATRLGLGIVETRRIDPAGEPPEGPFDAVLVDVPCSNTGVLGRRPEARWRLKPSDLRELTGLQRHLLRLACSRVRPGGVVVYSTCSIEPEENGGLVRSVLTEIAGFELEAEEERLPGAPSDGGYWARLRRKQ